MKRLIRTFAMLVIPAWLTGYVEAASTMPAAPQQSAPLFTAYTGSPWLINVFPKTAPAGTPRTIVVTGSCPSAFTLDASVAGTVAVTLSGGLNCPVGLPPTKLIPYQANTPGSVSVQLRFPGNDVAVSEATMTTTSAPRGRSSTDLSGMWFDPSTNGSGIAFHHQPLTDSAFGTWFIYGTRSAMADRNYWTSSRWLSVQFMQWLDASTVEALVLETASQVGACTTSASCPRTADQVSAVGIARFTLTGSDAMRMEVFDLSGTSLVVSNLTRYKL